MSGWRSLPAGAAVLRPGSTADNITGTWRVVRPVIDQERCIRCGICWMYCPDSAILELKREYTTRGGKRYEVTYEVDYDHCKGCGICANECPVKAIEVVLEAK